LRGMRADVQALDEAEKETAIPIAPPTKGTIMTHEEYMRRTVEQVDVERLPEAAQRLANTLLHLCGHRSPQADLDAAAANMAETQRLLELSPHRASGEELRQQRILAGLTLRQAARLLAVSPTILSGWEQGRDAPSAEQVRSLAGWYRVGPHEERP